MCSTSSEVIMWRWWRWTRLLPFHQIWYQHFRYVWHCALKPLLFAILSYWFSNSAFTLQHPCIELESLTFYVYCPMCRRARWRGPDPWAGVCEVTCALYTTSFTHLRSPWILLKPCNKPLIPNNILHSASAGRHSQVDERTGSQAIAVEMEDLALNSRELGHQRQKHVSCRQLLFFRSLVS
jgi:hypothetical protein